MPAEPHPPRHFSMIRSFRAADLCTLANAACGVASVLLALAYVDARSTHALLLGCALAPLALVFDVLDGRLARFSDATSAFGRELDSLADVISFGVAPAALAWAAGMDGGWDAVLLMYFVCCGVSRLARYNVTAESLSAGAAKVPYFEGTPIPTSVVLVALIAWATWIGRIGSDLLGGYLTIGPWQLHALVLLFGVSGSLMISKTLRIPKL
jgi:CDP-diacylglycerol--serine O-phosphatidyltransferase